MTKERTYQDDEVREILDLAIQEDDSAPLLPESHGLTLRELQEVGRGIGLPPERLAEAVRELEGRGRSVPRGTALGLPVSVGRIVPLPRPPSEREWEMLVSELRTTFGTKGEVTSQGGLREWSSGTLHAFVEPTEAGHRLRLADSSPAVGIGITMGGFFLAFGLLILVVLLGKDDPGFRFAVPAFFSLIGGGLVGGTVVMLPRWAEEQEQRMERVASHAASLLASPASEEA